MFIHESNDHSGIPWNMVCVASRISNILYNFFTGWSFLEYPLTFSEKWNQWRFCSYSYLYPWAPDSSSWNFNWNGLTLIVVLRIGTKQVVWLHLQELALFLWLSLLIYRNESLISYKKKWFFISYFERLRSLLAN